MLQHLRAENDVKLSVPAWEASNVTYPVDPKLLVDVDSRDGNPLFHQRVTHETGTDADLEACAGTHGKYFCDLMPVAAPPRLAVIMQPVVVMGAGDLDLAHVPGIVSGPALVYVTSPEMNSEAVGREWMTRPSPVLAAPSGHPERFEYRQRGLAADERPADRLAFGLHAAACQAGSGIPPRRGAGRTRRREAMTDIYLCAAASDNGRPVDSLP